MQIVVSSKLNKEFVSPERFLSLNEEEKCAIKSVQYCVNDSNNLNDSNLGGFMVEWNVPKYKLNY